MYSLDVLLEHNTDKLDLLMELMKHSLGTPIPDEKLNYSFNEFSLLRPSDDLIQKIEEK